MSAMLIDTPLGLACVFSDGSTARFDLRDVRCPGLVRDLLVGLVALTHPHGSVDAAGTVKQYVLSIRDMSAKLAARGFTGAAADLRRVDAVAYWMDARHWQQACTRRMLQGFADAGGQLDVTMTGLAAGKAYNPRRRSGPRLPYSEAEWERLTTTCREVIDESYAAHQRALAAAARGQHPRDGGWNEENLRWLLMRIGPVGAAELAEHGGWSKWEVYRRGGYLGARAELFPTYDVVTAYRLLFGIYSGIVPDGIDDLVTADIDWAGDATILLSYVKGRTTAERLTLPRRAVRLLERWLDHSALLRSHSDLQSRRRLWLWVSSAGGAQVYGVVGWVALDRWVQRHGVTADEGRPLRVHRSRIRTTHFAMRDKEAWAGRRRATIDPNHSVSVEADHYVAAITPTQRREIDTIVEDAQHDLLRRAHPPVVLTEQDTALLTRDYPQLMSALPLDDTVISQLVGGQRDVFTAACADQLSGLHGPKGKPCPARPWVCLLCPLAVFAPRHAANLLRLKAFFSRQWQQMPAAQFMSVFGPYSQRIDEILKRFDPTVLARSAAYVSDRDHELPLRPEESTR